MKVLKSLLEKILPKSVTTVASDYSASAEKIRNLLGACPICGNNFANHKYALIATVVIGKERNGRVTEFFKTLKEHQWDDFLKFQEWESTSDNVEAYLLRCINHQSGVLVLRSPTELYESDSLLTVEVLNQEETSELEQLCKQVDWRMVLP